MNVLIVDCNETARQHLSTLIQNISGCKEVGQVEDGVEAIYQTHKLDVDVLLIDVETPQADGIETIRQVNKMNNPPLTIITTSSPDNAMAAFNANVFSYLLKPIREKKLRGTLEPVSYTHLTLPTICSV